MSLKPELNEKLMEFYCYLLDLSLNKLDMKEIDSYESSESNGIAIESLPTLMVRHSSIADVFTRIGRTYSRVFIIYI